MYTLTSQPPRLASTGQGTQGAGKAVCLAVLVHRGSVVVIGAARNTKVNSEGGSSEKWGGEARGISPRDFLQL